MAVDQSLSTRVLPLEAGRPKPSSPLQEAAAVEFWLLLVTYAAYFGAYVSVCQASTLKKLWSIMMLATQRMVSGPAAFVVPPVNEDWSPMTPFESMAEWKKLRPAVIALFQYDALAVSKQAHT